MAFRFYKVFMDSLGATPPNWAVDTITCSLHTNAHTPNFDTHDYFDDVNNEVTGSGYTPGGQNLASKTKVTTMADAWGVQRANATAYELGQIVRPATGNGWLYECVVAGTSGGSIPAFPTYIGGEVADGAAKWACIGRGITVFDAADPTWNPSTIANARHAIYRKNTGTPSTSMLIGCDTFASDQSSSSGAMTVVIPAAEGVYFLVMQ
jgi:hypothetical protein